MNHGINLAVNEKKSKLAPSRNRIKILRLGAIAILFGIGIFSVAISILIVLSPLPQLKKEEEHARTMLSVFIIDINKLYFINDRGDSIRRLLSARNAYDKKLTNIKSKMPTGVELLGFTAIKKRYTLKFTSHSLLSLDQLLNAIAASTGKKGDFIRAYLTSLSVDQEKHNFVMIVDLLTV